MAPVILKVIWIRKPNSCRNTRRTCKIPLFHYLGKNSEVPSQKKRSPRPPPLAEKRKLTCMITKKEMQCSVSRLLSFSSGRTPRILRPFTTPVQHEKSQRSRTAIHLFSIFFLPRKCIIVRFSFGYFVLVFYVNDLALLNHSINRPLTQKFLDSLWLSANS